MIDMPLGKRILVFKHVFKHHWVNFVLLVRVGVDDGLLDGVVFLLSGLCCCPGCDGPIFSVVVEGEVEELDVDVST